MNNLNWTENRLSNGTGAILESHLVINKQLFCVLALRTMNPFYRGWHTSHLGLCEGYDHQRIIWDKDSILEDDDLEKVYAVNDIDYEKQKIEPTSAKFIKFWTEFIEAFECHTALDWTPVSINQELYSIIGYPKRLASPLIAKSAQVVNENLSELPDYCSLPIIIEGQRVLLQLNGTDECPVKEDSNRFLEEHKITNILESLEFFEDLDFEKLSKEQTLRMAFIRPFSN